MDSSTSTWPIGTAGEVTGAGAAVVTGAPPRRPSPRPGTRRTGRPTCRSPSRTRCSGRRTGGFDFDMAVTLGEAADSRLAGLWRRRCAVTYAGLGRAWNDQAGRGGWAGCHDPLSRRAADARRRRRAAGVSRQTVSNAVNNPDLLRADTLARVQEAIDELGYSPNRAARNLRTRASHLIGAASSPGPGGHRQRRDGPVRALAGRDVARGGLPRAAVRRRGRGRPERVRRPAALHGRRRVRRHRHLPRQPAGRLAASSAGRRSWRSAGRGTTPRPPTPVGRRRRGGRGRPWPPRTCSTAATSGSPGSAGARTPASARTAGRAGRARCGRAACSTTGLASPGRGHRRVRPRGRAPYCSTRPAHGVRVRLRHPGDGRPAHPARARPAAPAATSRWSASTTPRSPRWSRPGSPRCASRWRRSPSRWSGARGPARPAAGRRVARRAAHPDARGARLS